MANVDPDPGVQDTGTEPSTTSDALTLNETCGTARSSSLRTVGGAGTLMFGAIVSTTETVNDADA